MKNEILEFDKRKIAIEEMIEHYNFYMDLSEQGLKLINNEGNNREARVILKTITDSLKKEYKYYNKAKVLDIIYKLNNKVYSDYTQGVYESYAKIVYANSYSYLSSNLCDIQYYMRHWFKLHIDEYLESK